MTKESSPNSRKGAASTSDEAPLTEEERVRQLAAVEAELAKIKTEQAEELARLTERFENRHYSARAHLYGALIIAGNVALYFAALQVAFQINQELSGLNPFSPGHKPPFYFLQRDWVEGVVMVLPLLIACVLAGAYYRRAPVYAIIAVTQSFLQYGTKIAVAVVIGLKTSHLFTPGASTSDWPTLAAYHSDPWIWGSKLAVYTVVLIIAFVPPALQWLKWINFRPTQA